MDKQSNTNHNVNIVRNTQTPSSNSSNENYINQAKATLGINDVPTAEYYLNLAFLQNLDVSEKIKALAMKNYIYANYPDSVIVLATCFKLKKIYKQKDLHDLQKDQISSFIRCYYRLCKNFERKSNLVYLTNILINDISNLVSTFSIETEMPEVELLANSSFKKIQENLDIEKKKFLNEKFRSELFEIKKIFDSKKHMEASQNTNKYYLVSTHWLQCFMNFLNHCDLNFIDKFFDRKNFCNMIVECDIDDSFINEHGIYPGPINNYPIVNFVDYWHDPDTSLDYTNSYTKKGIQENIDFVYINPEIYSYLKSNFDSNFDIERRLINKNGNEMIEVELLKIKVLILSEVFSTKLKHHLRLKYIQISKTATLEEFKSKILRVYSNTLSNKIYSNNLKLFIPNHSKKDFHDLIVAYSNDLKSRKIEGVEINDADSTIMENLKLGPKDIIIVEIKSQNDSIRKEYFLSIKLEEVMVCSFCNKNIDKNNIFPCKSCQQYFYCSNECKLADKSHLHYHEVTANLIERKINLEDLISININDLLHSHARKGLMGMKNLGNTCFMNSAMQCLSHCQEITKYFLLKKYKEEINQNNKYGSGGQIAVAYHELVKELWTGTNSYLSPWDFRKIFVSFVKQFAGFTQHDSHEMLSFILDALHEDLNRVKSKPYEELPEKQLNENEDTASTRWWKNHLRRENSIIVDFFHGQYKSVVTCPDCKRISITYDPFMYLGLPIPSGQKRLKFKLFLLNNYSIEELLININQTTIVKDLKTIASNFTNKSINNIDAILCHQNYNFIANLGDKDSSVLSYFQKNMEVVLYETEYALDQVNKYFTFYINPGIMKEESYLMGRKRKVFRPIFYNQPIQVSRTSTVEELYYKIFKFYRKLLPDMEGRPLKTFLINLENRNEDYIKEEFMVYFQNVKKLPFTLRIVNNIPEALSVYDKQRCEFCESRDCEGCSFNFTFNIKISNIINTLETMRPLILNLEILAYRTEGLILYQNFSKDSKPLQFNDTVSIYDCLDEFKLEEKLEKENTWYCSVCKDHKEAFKKLDIYRAPNILIIQLKRFKIKSGFMGFQESRKNESMVDFPIYDLDLSKYIVGPNKDAKYNLFAISQHFGGLGGGHYKAVCNSGNSWYEFDDEDVSKFNSSVVNKSAYMLFYRKKVMF